MSQYRFIGSALAKCRAGLCLLALVLLGLAAPQWAQGQTPGASASGTYRFALADRYVKYAEFEARTQSDGTTTGRLFLSDEAEFTEQDVDGTGEKEVTYSGFTLTAEVDGLLVERNRAVMSGTVRESSLSQFVGRRVLLTVEDNGDGSREPDKLTWGLYKPVQRDWIPSDAELKEDPGVGLTWTATDAERRDDPGIPMPRSEAIGCQTFPLSSYDFFEVIDWAGDIVVASS